MAIDSDLELMLRARSGDAESFELLLDRHRRPLIRYFCAACCATRIRTSNARRSAPDQVYPAYFV